ncbi:hypothetical protein KKC1_31160 [Calderihabitans maritimus]|uniref:Uncharacterized protein n=1 Tax=Calderihabitans maritimus TaxID=1246530 RepID=A0A1Z5HWT9_9FIRM|nr:hypothetical protein KKC1_31160 [Calderihabitans maritimus]
MAEEKLREFVDRGYQIYYLREMRQFNRSVYGFDPLDYGAVLLDVKAGN